MERKEKTKMNARQCDRCGALYTNADIEKLQNVSIAGFGKIKEMQLKIEIGTTQRTRRFDLCPECMRRQVKFLRWENLLDLIS